MSIKVCPGVVVSVGFVFLQRTLTSDERDRQGHVQRRRLEVHSVVMEGGNIQYGITSWCADQTKIS